MSILPVKCTFAILIMTLQVCGKCSAVFIDGQLFWQYSGKPGKAADLAALVCVPYGNSDCINPLKNCPSDNTFESRQAFIKSTLVGGIDP
jgi:hypothetical protein